MQTFLPYPEFDKSASVLDRQRLGKRRFEVYQIIRSITFSNCWSHHPIVKMWTGLKTALKLFSNSIVTEWIRHGYRNNLELYYLTGYEIDFP
jgi:UDP-N-acetylmuramate-alanine ligase